MTAPQQPAPVQSPAQAPAQSPVPAPATVPVPAPVEGNPATAAWPPDDATLMQLMMDARFSIIEEPAGEADSVRAETGAPPAGPQAPAPPAKE